MDPALLILAAVFLAPIAILVIAAITAMCADFDAEDLK